MSDDADDYGHPATGCDEPHVCGMEVRGVYDGVLYWFCLSCGVAWQRWTPPGRLFDTAARYIEENNERLVK